MDDPALWAIQDAERYLMTIDEAAAALGIGRRAVEGLVARGKLTKVFLKGRPFLATYAVELYQFNKKRKKSMLQDSENHFIGVNPHLMSLLQTPGSGADTAIYPSFHGPHIAHITDFLNDVLPPHYIAVQEPSLQIKGREAPDEPSLKKGSPKPDVAIYQQRESASIQASTEGAVTPTLTVEMVLQEPSELAGVAIYEVQAMEHGVHGLPVVRIELLSPANMVGGSFYEVYQQSRTKALAAGTPLVEIDYLHEYLSPVRGVPIYPQEANAKAYNITVSRPKEKIVDVYLFGINEPIPTVYIPLKGEEYLNFDFDGPYQHTWKKSRFWYYVDYGQDPLRMNTYSADDQAKIRAQMAAAAEKLGKAR